MQDHAALRGTDTLFRSGDSPFDANNRPFQRAIRTRSIVISILLPAVQGVWQRDEESGGEVRHLIA